mmetsp:Transcript_9513/g.10584  ORF Transcript_9513/g.10584 Transcript_9513/m.10584 type:complete len:765 (-) Transcript_9513:72-2366(-)
MTRIVKVLLLIAYLRIASAVLPTDNVGIVGFCDEMTNSNLQLLTTPSSPFERRGGVVSLTLSLPNMNDKTRISTVSVWLNCESKPSSTCGNGLKCYHCRNSEGFDGHFVVNKETDFLIGVLSNAIDDTKFEIRTDSKARDVQLQFRYRGVSMKDVKISVGGISVPNEEMSTVTLGPNDHRSAVREAYAPVRSSEALPTKRTDVDRELSPASDDGSVVDLLYYFSRRAACQWLEKDGFCTLEAEDQSELETLVGEINDYGNTALSNSQIPTSFNVVKVHVDLVYDEGTSISSTDRLNWVAGSIEAANLRDEYKADLVVDVFYYYLQGYTNYASGIGMTPNFFPSRANGYSSTGGTFMFLDETITHEIGHNFGAQHDRYVEGGGVEDESFYGYINCNECFTTIMSYTDECAALGKCNSGNSVPIIPYFSNPNLKYEGVSMGDTDTNNAFQLTRSAPGVAINQYSSINSKSIFSQSRGTFTIAGVMAVKFDIVPKKDLILKNIELEVSTDMKISVYIVTGPYADVTDWGIPIVTETLTPLSKLHKLNSQLRGVALYVSFPDKPLDANQVYAVRIERQDNDTNGYMVIASYGEGDPTYFENDDVTVNSGKMVDFNENEYTNNAGLNGGLIYDYKVMSPITSSPTSSPETSTPTSSLTTVDCEDDTKIKFLIGPDKKKCIKIKANQCDTEYETKKDGKKKPENVCPSICNPKCLCFEDKNKKYKLKGKDKKLKCRKIEKKELCETKVKGTDGKKANKVCPVSCKYNDCT